LAQVVRRMPSQVDERIQEAMIHPPILPRHVEPVRPPLVTEALKKAMLAPENILEDAMYAKIVPNDYLVELNDQIFERFFAPLERDLIEQWSQVLVTHLNDTAIRLQPQRYRAGGPVRIRLQPAPPSELAEDRFRIHAWVRPDVAPAALATRRARLELLGGTQQWPLRDGVTTIGRDPDCDVHLDLPIVHEKPLISGRQAHILGSEKGFTVLDGAPGGRASRNGTYVNGRRVRPGGVPLQDGDHIILAALDPNDPRPDTEGVVTLIFHVDQPSAISRQPSASGS
jgi:hypothetical protein